MLTAYHGTRAKNLSGRIEIGLYKPPPLSGFGTGQGNGIDLRMLVQKR